jgi:hypothetical protein
LLKKYQVNGLFLFGFLLVAIIVMPSAIFSLERLNTKILALKDLNVTPEAAWDLLWPDLAFVRAAMLQEPAMMDQWIYGAALKAVESTHEDGAAPFCPSNWEHSLAVGFLFYIWH